MNLVVKNILQNRKYDFMDSYKKRRFRLSEEQSHLLELEFSTKNNWSKKEIDVLSKKLRLPVSKLYKWNWDRNKRVAIKNLFGVEKVEDKDPTERIDPLTLRNIVTHSATHSEEHSGHTDELGNTKANLSVSVTQEGSREEDKQ